MAENRALVIVNSLPDEPVEEARRRRSQCTAHNFGPEVLQTQVLVRVTGTREFFLDDNVMIALCASTVMDEWAPCHWSGTHSDGTRRRNSRAIDIIAAISMASCAIA
jgi:hypothetical protein